MELTPQQIAVENIRVGRGEVSLEKLEEMFLNPYLPSRFLEDETVLGTTVLEVRWDRIILGGDDKEGGTPFLLYLKEKYGENLPERYKKGAELLEKAEKMDDSEVVSHISNLVERAVRGKFFLTEDEEVAVIKSFRYPEKFISEIRALYSVSVKIGENIIKKVGLDIGITPTNTLVFLKNKFALPDAKLAIFYFTNHYWYGKEEAFNLFIENTGQIEITTSILKSIPYIFHKDVLEQIERPEFKFYWEKLKVDLSVWMESDYLLLSTILANSSDREMKEIAEKVLERCGIVLKTENTGKKMKVK